MRTSLGGCLGAVAGLVTGLPAGLALAIGVVPERPGHALDKLGPMMAITLATGLVCLIAGVVAGVRVAGRKDRDQAEDYDDEGRT